MQRQVNGPKGTRRWGTEWKCTTRRKSESGWRSYTAGIFFAVREQGNRGGAVCRRAAVVATAATAATSCHKLHTVATHLLPAGQLCEISPVHPECLRAQRVTKSYKECRHNGKVTQSYTSWETRREAGGTSAFRCRQTTRQPNTSAGPPRKRLCCAVWPAAPLARRPAVLFCRCWALWLQRPFCRCWPEGI